MIFIKIVYHFLEFNSYNKVVTYELYTERSPLESLPAPCSTAPLLLLSVSTHPVFVRGSRLRHHCLIVGIVYCSAIQ